MSAFTSPDEQPYGCFHPASPRSSFSDDGLFWLSITHYLAAQKVRFAADRETVRRAESTAMAAQLASQMELEPGWEERVPHWLRHAVRRVFESNLSLRSCLLSTGKEPIEARLEDPLLGTGSDGRGANWLGQVLEEVRELVRQRADDPDAIQCEHQDAEQTDDACVHLFGSNGPRHRRFTGQGRSYHLVCGDCRQALPTLPPTRKVCSACFSSIQRGGPSKEDLGEPFHRERASSLGFEHRTVKLPALDARDVVDMVPIPRMPGAWWIRDRAERMHRADFTGAVVETCAVLPAEALELTSSVTMHSAPDGRLVALTETYGRRAVVFDPRTGQVTMRLLRDDYHHQRCSYPFAFFELEGRLLIIHATEWNRLDVVDPVTGALLTARSPEPAEGDRPSPEHALDYFHAGLELSPSGERVIDNGWVWHPVGVVRVFSVKRWLQENCWEPEDGPSAKVLCARSYYWDGPVCWLDEQTVAVWGEGEGDYDLTPGVRIFDALTGTELRAFPGPAGSLIWNPPYLVSQDERLGTSVWDVHTGERLAREPSLLPAVYHPGSSEFVTASAGEGFRVSRLHGG